MHRSGAIHDEMLHILEHDLDLQEVSARHARG
jgi:CPA1 family monovalent cation:H+ antiporter